VEWQEQLRILGQVALAMALAAIFGSERELARKPAGLRTHMLVSGAAALLVGLGFTIVRRFAGSSEYPLVRVDPVVVIQAVVTAVGFWAPERSSTDLPAPARRRARASRD
jgi:putative Mg2+ transporter-C (MgtC) family protein